MTLQARFSDWMARALPGPRPDAVAVAVSGGSDSLALLHLTCNWMGEPGRVTAVTVDHGLRAESAAEAAWVAKTAKALGTAHVTLTWQGWQGAGNLQAEARRARYALLSNWAKAQAMPSVVLLGHTRDDLAETFLMRLARGSGVDGLAAMADTVEKDGTRFLRPLLEERRQLLRDHLIEAGMTWIDDPSNEDPQFDRVRLRRAMADLGALGLTTDRLAGTAQHLARARQALEARSERVAKDIATEPLPGIILLERTGFAATERETQLRLLAHGLSCVASRPYRPRVSALEAALDAALVGKASTLHGGHILATGAHVILVRELAAVADASAPADGRAQWDTRWRIDGARLSNCEIRPLGAKGASEIDRPEALPHAALTSYPGVWSGETLVAAPMLWHAALCQAHYQPQSRFHA